jgi:predicted DNA-binding transcriptional regulator YafY
MKNDQLKRTHRLIKIIQEIKLSPYRSIEDLAAYLGISRAQFYKDKTALERLGFEFSYDRNRRRFVITKDAYLPVENLSISERISLIMAVRQLSATGDYLMSYEGLNAARKLAADLPLPVRENSLSLFDDLVLKEGFGCRRVIMERLQTAVTENRRVALAYRRPDGTESNDVEFDPYHLFFQRRALYVEGYCVNEKGIRMYRLNRIQHVAFTPVHFAVKDDYDFGERHRNAFSVFPGETTERVVVRFSAGVRSYIQESLWHHSQVINREKNGSILFRVDVAEPREVMWWAFQWGADAEILEPAWLREEAKRATEKMAIRYKVTT